MLDEVSSFSRTEALTNALEVIKIFDQQIFAAQSAEANSDTATRGPSLFADSDVRQEIDRFRESLIQKVARFVLLPAEFDKFREYFPDREFGAVGLWYAAIKY